MINFFTKVLASKSKNMKLKIPDQYFALERLIKDQAPVVIDGGAHRGETLKYIKSLFSESVVYCFEPSLEAFKELSEVSQNYKSVTIENLALSNHCGKSVININSYDQTNSMLKTAPAAELSWGEKLLDNRSQEQITTVILDDYCQANKIELIDILKLDLQGSEILALSGCARMLSEGRIKFIIVEIILVETYVDQPSIQQYFNLLSSKNYRLIGIYNSISKHDRLLQADFLFELPT